MIIFNRFVCNRWLDRREDDGKIELDLTPSEVTKKAGVIPYEISVFTGDLYGAGTDAKIFIQMYGLYGKTEEIVFKNFQGDRLQRLNQISSADPNIEEYWFVCRQWFDKIKIATPTRVDVVQDEMGVTASTIATEAVSTCHFILLMGYYNLQRFALLYHTPAHYTSSSETASEEPSTSGSSSGSSSPQQIVWTAMSALVDLLKKIGEELIVFIPSTLDTQVEYIDFSLFNNLKILVGGSVDHDYDLIHNGFNLLNDENNNHEILTELEQHPSFYLIQKLNNNIKILKPMTFYQSKQFTKLGLKGVDVPEPPCLFVKYDCLLNVANIFIELYINSSTTYCLASMYINFNDDDVQYLWKLEHREINEAQLDMRANSLELDWLNKSVDFISSQINDDKTSELSDEQENSELSIEQENSSSLNVANQLRYDLIEKPMTMFKSNLNKTQVVLHVKFNQLVNIHSVSIKASENNGPKTIKLLLNQETVDIDYVNTNEPIETIE
ncbi:unnamed protein product [Rotaria sp. Silwood2]|nr:unnamed protein product [Rotaria sp. Silwood2]